MNQVAKKMALVSSLLLILAATLGAAPALAADPSFSMTGTPNKASYPIGEQATVQAVLHYNDLTAAKWINMKLYNSSHYEGQLGQMHAVSGTAGYTNTTIYSMPANATAKVGSKIYTLKAVENTTNIVVATATIVINIAAAGYVLSVAWADASGDRVIALSESVIFTVYLAYSNLPAQQAVTLYVSLDAGTPVSVLSGNLKAGSGTNTTTYSCTFATQGLHTVIFSYVNASITTLASNLLQLSVGQNPPAPQGSALDLVTANAIPIAFGFGIVIVLLLFYIARSKKR